LCTTLPSASYDSHALYDTNSVLSPAATNEIWTADMQKAISMVLVLISK
jgi:hypothetical protein